MKVLPSSNDSLAIALNILRTGGVVAHATETCYGLACDLQNPEAVDRLFAIKQRSNSQPVSALFATVEQAQIYLNWNEEASQMAAEHLPGPLTIIMKKTPGCNLRVCPSGSESIGLRISSHPTAHALVEKFGSPLSTTSANIHGQPNTFSVQDIEKQFADAGHKPDLILDDGPLEEGDASTVVDVSGGVLHVLRQGDIAPSNN